MIRALLLLLLLSLAACDEMPSTSSSSNSPPTTEPVAEEVKVTHLVEMSDLDEERSYMENVQYIDYANLYSRPDTYQELTVSFVGAVTHLFEHRGKTMFTLTLFEEDPYNQMVLPVGDLLWYSDKTTNLNIGDYIGAIGRIKGPHATFQTQLAKFWGTSYTFNTRSGVMPDQVPVVWLYGYEVWEDYIWGEEHFDYPEDEFDDFEPSYW